MIEKDFSLYIRVYSSINHVSTKNERDKEREREKYSFYMYNPSN